MEAIGLMGATRVIPDTDYSEALIGALRAEPNQGSVQDTDDSNVIYLGADNDDA